MRKGLCLAACGTLLAAGPSLLTAAAPAANASTAGPADGSTVVGHTYVNDNAAGANSVAGFDRHADGSLTPIAGSPFPAGGAGFGRGLGSQGAIQLSADKRYLLVADAGSSQISVLRLSASGVPKLVGAPVSSGGIEPVSIAVHGNLVYVANAGAGASNYTGFRLNVLGGLQPISNSTFALPDGSGPGDVIFDPAGQRLVGTRDDTSLLDSFRVRLDGRLVPDASSPIPAQVAGPIGAQFRPTNSSQLYVTNAHGGPGTGSVSAFNVDLLGHLTSIGTSPFANFQTASCWVEISHDGRYLFSVNTASATISRYSINRDGSLVLIGSTPFNNGLGAVDARLSPDGRTLGVTGGRGQVVSMFSVSGGDLTELPGSPTPLPAGTAPTGIVVT
jgi:6-phosphogluconolactonase